MKGKKENGETKELNETNIYIITTDILRKKRERLSIHEIIGYSLRKKYSKHKRMASSNLPPKGFVDPK